MAAGTNPSNVVVPLLGQVYHLTCPVCTSTHEFRCDSLRKPFTKCCVCSTGIDLRDLSVLPENEEDNVIQQEPVQYCNEVELAVGSSGGAGAVDQVFAAMEEASMTMKIPSYLSFESNEAIVDEKAAIQQKKPMFRFVTQAIEALLFGRQPFCTVGHIKVFQKKIPMKKKYAYIPVPRTSSSYSLLFTLVAFFFVGSLLAAVKSETHWLPRFFLLLFLVLWVYKCLFKVVYGDPGFLVPGYISGDENAGTRILDRERAFTYQEPENLLLSIEAGKRPSRFETVNGIQMERKWCTQCQFYRPPRAAHCYQCGLCASVHDHHCGVTGGCVASGNLRAFVWFLWVGQLSSFLAGFSALHSLLSCPQCFSSLTYILLVLLSVMLPWGVALMTCGLMLSLLYGISKEETTRERIQGSFQMKKNPYNRGWRKNILATLCGPCRHSNTLFSEEIMSFWAGASESRKIVGNV